MDWTRGYEPTEIKALVALFRQADRPYVLGPFSNVRAQSIPEWLEKNQLRIASGANSGIAHPKAALLVKQVYTSREVKDFSGTTIAAVEPGMFIAQRMAGASAALAKLLKLNQPELVQIWEENAEQRALVERLGYRWAYSRISAYAEITGCYLRPDIEPKAPVAKVEFYTLNKLKLKLDVTKAAAAIERYAKKYINHYSLYNKRDSWSALVLRGYGGKQDFIIKPSEMSKDWKAEHPREMAWTISDTPLRKRLPELEPLIRAIPGVHHRVRLMKLSANKGELARHCDITDPDAGVGPKQTLRIHIPIVTNPNVIFEQWNLRGEHLQTSMRAGEAWYLDTRKPHRARNTGSADRVHLVIDVEANSKLFALLGSEAPIV